VKCLAMVTRPKGNHPTCTEPMHAMSYKSIEYIYISAEFFFFSLHFERNERKESKQLSYYCVKFRFAFFFFSYDNRGIIKRELISQFDHEISK